MSKTKGGGRENEPVQMDLFAAHEPAAPPKQAFTSPVVPKAWKALLDRAGEIDVRIDASPLWTGTILEVLYAPRIGRFFLWHDGHIQQVKELGPLGRTIFVKG